VGGVPDVVSLEHAILVAPEKPREIAEALAEVSSQPAAALARADQGGERLRKSFSRGAWVGAINKAYEAARINAARRRHAVSLE